ncbi:MAG: hypothetical protein V7K27_28415 [Nostoc sp.]|uniref:hypothetical protein n=1 Tax=Nostoc sp. TaxID=1180 RepID=UPI002FF9E754
MNFSRLSVLVGAVTAAAVSIAAFPSSAHALDFNWSFSNVTGSTSGTVTGTVNGLVEGANSGGPPAVVTVTSAPLAASAGLGTYTFSDGTFTVTGGNITFADWHGAFGSNNLFLGTNAGGGTYYPQLADTGFNIANSNPGASVSFTSAAVPFDIPGGATIPAVGGLLALGLMRKARKSLASNTRFSEPIREMVS